MAAPVLRLSLRRTAPLPVIMMVMVIMVVLPVLLNRYAGGINKEIPFIAANNILFTPLDNNKETSCWISKKEVSPLFNSDYWFISFVWFTLSTRMADEQLKDFI